LSCFVFQEAAALESEDPSVIFDLGLEYAEQRQLSTALDCAKRFLDRSGGAWGQGWQFLALLLTAQERHTEAELVLQAAIEETGAGEQGPLLRTQAKVQRALGQSLQAIQTYRQLLALVQVEQKSSGGTGSRGDSKVEILLSRDHCTQHRMNEAFSSLNDYQIHITM
jgi:tetratricopeptide (TPR) repeat protein